MSGAAARIAENWTELEAYLWDRIYNMDETGLCFRWIPNRAYGEVGTRRRARGTRAMKAKDRVTLVLACNATGTHKISLAVVGKAEQPQCFQRPRAPCPLPQLSHKSAWMNSNVFKSWFETVFLIAVRARTDQPVVLISDNCASHEELQRDQVKFIALPPNCTALYQPLDLGVIACLKRRSKRRLLDRVVGAIESHVSAYAATAAAPASQTGVALVAAGGPTAPSMATGATGAPRYGDTTPAAATCASVPGADTPAGRGREAPACEARPATQRLNVGGMIQEGTVGGTQAVTSQPAHSEQAVANPKFGFKYSEKVAQNQDWIPLDP